MPCKIYLPKIVNSFIFHLKCSPQRKHKYSAGNKANISINKERFCSVVVKLDDRSYLLESQNASGERVTNFASKWTLYFDCGVLVVKSMAYRCLIDG